MTLVQRVVTVNRCKHGFPGLYNEGTPYGQPRGHGVLCGTRLSLLFYALATSKAISGRIPTCDSAHSWSLYSAAPMGDQATSTMT